MDKNDAELRIKKLKNEIVHHRYLYHVLDKQEISDGALDALKHELATLEEQFPEFVTSDSPTQRVGGEPMKGFKKVTHSVRQWSFNDAFSEEEIRKWDERVKKGVGENVEYVCELKIDGLHVVCTYEKGVLTTAATRGDGKVGEDVTHNVRTIASVPLRLQKDMSVTVEGEVWIPREAFSKINRAREKAGEEPFKNPRNAAAGAIRQLDPKLAAQRGLDILFYELANLPTVNSQEQELKYLKELGFKTDKHWKLCGNIEKVIEFWKKWEKKRDSQPYWIDGVVVKVNSIAQQEKLGFTGKAPRFVLALKFATEQGTSVIRKVDWQVGRTGALTPVATMDPVQLVGTTVTHATLHNVDEIKRLDVRVGDTVIVEKAGDIIPKVIKVLPGLRPGGSKKIEALKKCPVCGSATEKNEGQVALYCSKKDCGAQTIRQIQHFVSKNAFDIVGFGKKNVEKFIELGLIKTPADIFRLKADDLRELEGFADIAADKLVAAIAQKKTISMERFITALGIRHVGEETAVLLAKRFGTLDNLKKVSPEELEEIDGIGPQAAQSLIDYFRDERNAQLLAELNELEVRPLKASIASSKLEGKTFVLTGTLANFTRDQAKDKIRQAGGQVSSSVSANTDFVVAGEKPGSKVKKASALGVKIIKESEFTRLLDK